MKLPAPIWNFDRLTEVAHPTTLDLNPQKARIEPPWFLIFHESRPNEQKLGFFVLESLLGLRLG